MHLSPSYGGIIYTATPISMQVFGVGLEDSVAEKFAKTVLGLCAKKMNKMWLTKVFEGFIDATEADASVTIRMIDGKKHDGIDYLLK